MKFARVATANVLGVLMSFGVAQAQWQEVFSTDFNSGVPSQVSGAGSSVAVFGWGGLGSGDFVFDGQMLRNAAGIIPGGSTQSPTRVTILGLPSHDTIRIQFLWALIDSWDGIGDANGPDRFNVTVDGVTVFSHVFNATGGTSDYTPPSGGLLSSGTQLGFTSGQYFDHDQAFDMSIEPTLLNIPHSSSSVTIDFFASGPVWQGANDESWAIDELKVSVPLVSATFCTAGTTTHGCVASIGSSGTPSATAASGFTISVAALEGQKQSILFYGIDNTGFFPTAWGASTSYLCVKHPTQRMGVFNTGGTFAVCDGSLAVDWNAYRAAQPTALGNPLSVGQHVFAQCWFHDPPSPKTTMLSDGLEFVLQP